MPRQTINSQLASIALEDQTQERIDIDLSAKMTPRHFDLVYEEPGVKQYYNGSMFVLIEEI